MKNIESIAFFSEDLFMLEGKAITKTIKLCDEVQELYNSSDENNVGKIAYTVYSYIEGPNTSIGNLNFGLSVLEPVTFQGECNMTRGHFHQDATCVEYYWCMKGTGLLMLMDATGETWTEEMQPGTIHKIDGSIGHRLINTGDTRLSVGACWSPGAGYNYERIEENPFKYRVFKDQTSGKWRSELNETYR